LLAGVFACTRQEKCRGCRQHDEQDWQPPPQAAVLLIQEAASRHQYTRLLRSQNVVCACTKEIHMRRHTCWDECVWQLKPGLAWASHRLRVGGLVVAECTARALRAWRAPVLPQHLLKLVFLFQHASPNLPAGVQGCITCVT
jgi:hypothetical protein